MWLTTEVVRGDNDMEGLEETSIRTLEPGSIRSAGGVSEGEHPLKSLTLRFSRVQSITPGHIQPMRPDK